jgi:hypothetical protein
MGGLSLISGPLTTQPVSARQTMDASNGAKVTIALLGDVCRMVSSDAALRLPEVRNQNIARPQQFPGGTGVFVPRWHAAWRGVGDTEARDLAVVADHPTERRRPELTVQGCRGTESRPVQECSGDLWGRLLWADRRRRVPRVSHVPTSHRATRGSTSTTNTRALGGGMVGRSRRLPLRVSVDGNPPRGFAVLRVAAAARRPAPPLKRSQKASAR